MQKVEQAENLLRLSFMQRGDKETESCLQQQYSRNSVYCGTKAKPCLPAFQRLMLTYPSCLSMSTDHLQSNERP